MIVLIDNYDSFVYNLARHFQRLGHETRVVRNDAIDPAGVRAHLPWRVVPGSAGETRSFTVEKS